MESIRDAGIRLPEILSDRLADLTELGYGVLGIGPAVEGSDIYLLNLQAIFPIPSQERILIAHAGHGGNSYELYIAIAMHRILLLLGNGLGRCVHGRRTSDGGAQHARRWHR